MKKVKTIQFIIRLVLSIVLVVAICVRVDWTVALFALLMLIKTELEQLYICA